MIRYKVLCKITEFILSDYSFFYSALNLTATLSELSLPGWNQAWPSLTSILSFCAWNPLSPLDAAPPGPALSSVPTSICILLIGEKDGTLRLPGIRVCDCVSSVIISSRIDSKHFYCSSLIWKLKNIANYLIKTNVKICKSVNIIQVKPVKYNLPWCIIVDYTPALMSF